LWPQTTATTYPENCNTGPVYDKNIEKQLFPELNRTWYDCSTDQSMHLWEHEYTKHLLCIPNIDQKEIFSKIMRGAARRDFPSEKLGRRFKIF
jgi:ribonuclease I